MDSAYSGCALRAFPGALKRGLGRGPDGPRRVLKDVHAFGALAPCEPLLRICEHPFIIDIAAPSVAHYGPVEVLRLPVGCPPDDETANHREMLFAPIAVCRR